MTLILSLDVKRPKSLFLQITPFKIVAVNRKTICSIFNSLNVSIYDYDVRLTRSIEVNGRRGQVTMKSSLTC